MARVGVPVVFLLVFFTLSACSPENPEDEDEEDCVPCDDEDEEGGDEEEKKEGMTRRPIPVWGEEDLRTEVEVMGDLVEALRREVDPKRIRWSDIVRARNHAYGIPHDKYLEHLNRRQTDNATCSPLSLLELQSQSTSGQEPEMWDCWPMPMLAPVLNFCQGFPPRLYPASQMHGRKTIFDVDIMARRLWTAGTLTLLPDKGPGCICDYKRMICAEHFPVCGPIKPCKLICEEWCGSCGTCEDVGLACPSDHFSADTCACTYSTLCGFYLGCPYPENICPAVVDLCGAGHVGAPNEGAIGGGWHYHASAGGMDGGKAKHGGWDHWDNPKLNPGLTGWGFPFDHHDYEKRKDKNGKCCKYGGKSGKKVPFPYWQGAGLAAFPAGSQGGPHGPYYVPERRITMGAVAAGGTRAGEHDGQISRVVNPHSIYEEEEGGVGQGSGWGTLGWWGPGEGDGGRARTGVDEHGKCTCQCHCHDRHDAQFGSGAVKRPQPPRAEIGFKHDKDCPCAACPSPSAVHLVGTLDAMIDEPASYEKRSG